MDYDEFVNTCEKYSEILKEVETYIDCLWTNKYFPEYSKYNKITFDSDFYNDNICFSQTLVVTCKISTRYDDEYITTHYLNLPIKYFDMTTQEKFTHINTLIDEQNKILDAEKRLQETVANANKLKHLEYLKKQIFDLEHELLYAK